MRLIALFLMIPLFVVGLAPEAARAEDGEPSAPAAPTEEPAPQPAPAPKPDPRVPVYSIEYLMPTDEKAPEGWASVDAKGGPSEGELVALAEDLQLDDDVFYVETGHIQKDGATVGFAMIDVDRKVYPFQEALRGKASASGWRVSELGSPGRLLVTTDAAAEKALRGFVIYRLGDMAMGRMNGRGALEDKARDTALAYRDAIEAIQAGTGMAHVIEGRNRFIRARLDQWKGKKDAKVDKEENKKAADAFQKAIADGVSYPPRGRILVWASGELGGMLLVRKDKSVLPAATHALEVAVENEKDAREQSQRFSNRYNLACAYALSGETDKAIDAVKAALQTMKNLKGTVARKSWEDMAKDKDFDSIRNDPRFSKLYNEYEPAKPKHWDRMKAEQEKRRKEAEKKKKEKEGGE